MTKRDHIAQPFLCQSGEEGELRVEVNTRGVDSFTHDFLEAKNYKGGDGKKRFCCRSISLDGENARGVAQVRMRGRGRFYSGESLLEADDDGRRVKGWGVGSVRGRGFDFFFFFPTTKSSCGTR